MKLPFRQKKWRGQTGEFMGGGVGSSLDFQDHRNYLPGDDPRQINWQAYARTGSYSMKLYREEVRPMVDLVLEGSDSLFAFPEKEKRAVELFYYCCEAALQSGASLKVFLLKGGAHRAVTEEVVLGHGWPEELARLAPASGDEAPALERLPLRQGAMRLLLSDLLFPAPPESMAAALAVRGGRGLIFAPFGREESNPKWQGNYEFVEAENGSHHLHRVEDGLLKRYLEAYGRHFDLWKSAALRHGVSLARVSSEVGFQAALQAEALAIGAVEM